MNYQEWLDDWLYNYVQPSSERRTYERYGEIVHQHVVPALGATEMNDLTPFAMQQFVTELLQKGNVGARMVGHRSEKGRIAGQ